MKKIKVGDRVKIVETIGELESYKELLGHTYTVEAIEIEDGTGYEYASLVGTDYSPYLFNCKLVDENVKQFTKSDLKSGDTEEMTLEEVCKELGRDIKIVKEH